MQQASFWVLCLHMGMTVWISCAVWLLAEHEQHLECDSAVLHHTHSGAKSTFQKTILMQLLHCVRCKTHTRVTESGCMPCVSQQQNPVHYHTAPPHQHPYTIAGCGRCSMFCLLPPAPARPATSPVHPHQCWHLITSPHHGSSAAAAT